MSIPECSHCGHDRQFHAQGHPYRCGRGSSGPSPCECPGYSSRPSVPSLAQLQKSGLIKELNLLGDKELAAMLPGPQSDNCPGCGQLVTEPQAQVFAEAANRLNIRYDELKKVREFVQYVRQLVDSSRPASRHEGVVEEIREALRNNGYDEGTTGR